ncbi:endonuclease/exonuclease/phosphatase family protein [Biscogniauxia mediterranea]|nr:endonuclease/exonuclease/phosphatase family protein [Biscogniauxia mediterranea]
MGLTITLRWLAATATLLATGASAQTIAQINGNRFLSPYAGQAVSNVTGVVTAKGPSGIWLRSTTPGTDARVSDGLYVYGSALARNASIAVGDVIVVDGTVSEYRSSSAYLPLTELASPTVRAVLGKVDSVAPLVIGKDTLSPPTEQYTELDGGDVFAVPNNQSLVSVVNPVLQPDKYGLDFWESLVGELVTIESPRAVARPNQYGDTWVVGNWATTGDNGRTGLTITPGDGNPEAIIITDPLDGSDNPTDGKLGDKLEDITGIVTQVYGFYSILPLTSITVLETLSPEAAGPTTLASSRTCSGITVGSYNVENTWAGDAAHIAAVARHIAEYLRAPDLVFVQEIQDDSGETDDGTVDSGATLAALAAAIRALDPGAAYNYTYVNPLDGADGGAPGGNIRVAYLYRPEVLRLRDGAVAGNATQANEVLLLPSGPALRYNPGLIDPLNAAWENSRKPLAAAWEVVGGNSSTNSTLFTVNVHWGSKGGSSSLHGDARPPVNAGVDKRQAQAEVTASFISSLLSADPDARVLAAGDFNEFAFAAPVARFASLSGLSDLDEAAGVAPAERYTYLYDMNSQQLDHVFASSAMTAAAARGGGFEHVHVNTWLAYDDQTSDHDPSVARFDIC